MEKIDGPYLYIKVWAHQIISAPWSMTHKFDSFILKKSIGPTALSNQIGESSRIQWLSGMGVVFVRVVYYESDQVGPT